MSTSSRHLIVVGAGIFGVTAALELRRRGWRVSLIDRFEGGAAEPHPRASSTDVSKVIRRDYGADRFHTELAGEAMARWDDWNARFHRPLFHRTGFLLLSGSAFEAGGFEEASFRLLTERGDPVERIDAGTLARRFPAWNADRFPDGYLNPTAGWAESGAVVAELLGWAREAGVELVSGTVLALTETGGAPVVSFETAGGRRSLRADRVVVAAGAWSPRLLPELDGGVEARAMPVVHIRPRQPDHFHPDRFPVWGADIARTGWYGFPMHRDGFVKIGHHGRGWSDDPDHADALPDGFEDRLRDFLGSALPGLADGEIVARRVCFYADARDATFWIDRVQGRPGVVVATGGSGHGFKFGPVLGEVIANAVEELPDQRLEHFRWRPDAVRSKEEARSEAEA